jgi:DinB superfamily
MPAGGSGAHERSDMAEAMLRRLDAVASRLHRHAAGDVPAAALTDADPGTGERWDGGQVWAHLAEFIPYWLDQLRHVVAGYGGEPVPFGRVKSDPERLDAIERDRATPVSELDARLQEQVGEARVFLRELPDGAWAVRGVHSTLGVMTLERMLDEFIVGHLEQHAAQLDGLRAGS